MKKALSLILTVFFALSLAACANGTEGTPDPTGSPTEEPTEAPTDMPTEEPSAIPEESPTQKAALSAFSPKKSDLDEHDFNAVRSFLEQKDWYGIKNGEKLAALNNLVYDPDDPGTWSAYYWRGTTYPEVEADIRFKSPNFKWDENGRLCWVSLCYSDHSITRTLERLDLAGELDLSGCSRLYYLGINSTDITKVDISGCDSPSVVIRNCRQLENLISDDMTFRHFHVTECPKLTTLNWVMLSTSELEQLDHFWPDPDADQYVHANITIVSSPDDAGYIGIGGYQFDFGEPYSDDPYPPTLCTIIATEYTGEKFYGWYDRNGNLISTEPQLIIQYHGDSPYLMGLGNLVDLMGTTDIYLRARFSELP